MAGGGTGAEGNIGGWNDLPWDPTESAAVATVAYRFYDDGPVNARTADSLNTASFLIGATALTAAFWVRLASLDDQIIFRGSSFTGTRAGLRNIELVSGAMQFSFGTEDAGTASGQIAAVSIGATFSADTWYKVAFAFDGSQAAPATGVQNDRVVIYVDDVAQTQTALDGFDFDWQASIPNIAMQLRLGFDALADMYQFRLWNQALTSAQLTAETPATNRILPDVWYKMDENWITSGIFDGGLRPDADYGVNSGKTGPYHNLIWSEVMTFANV